MAKVKHTSDARRRGSWKRDHTQYTKHSMREEENVCRYFHKFVMTSFDSDS